jgi:hypothetical protein
LGYIVDEHGVHVDPSKIQVICDWSLIQMDLGGHPPFPLNHHFEPLVLINHDIHPFDGEWNVMSSSFVNYRHHVMVLCTCLQHSVNASDPIRTPQLIVLGLE